RSSDLAAPTTCGRRAGGRSPGRAWPESTGLRRCRGVRPGYGRARMIKRSGACLRKTHGHERAQDRSAETTARCRPGRGEPHAVARSEEHTSELQSRFDLVCRLLLEKKK